MCVPNEFLNELLTNEYPEEDCLSKLLNRWIRDHPDQPTWKEIADAIEELQDYSLASSIRGIYELAGLSSFHNPINLVHFDV